MIYLQSKKIFNQFAKLNIETGEAQYDNKNNLIEGEKISFSGTFSEVDTDTVFFFRHEGQLFLKIKDKTFLIHDHTTSNWEIMKSNAIYAVFSISEDGKVIYEKKYRPFASKEVIEDDLTAFVDEEDYDFFVFINNVLNSRERRKDIYKEKFVL